MKTPAIPVETLRNLVSHNPEEPFLRWKQRIHLKSIPGRPFGLSRPGQYGRIKLMGVKILSHRAVWALHHGEWPEGPLDHINGDTSDNRLSNLRRATVQQNAWNAGPRKTNPTGFKGVTRKGKRFLASIMVDNSRIRLGSFETPEEAALAYRAAARTHYGEFVRETPLPQVPGHDDLPKPIRVRAKSRYGPLPALPG